MNARRQRPGVDVPVVQGWSLSRVVVLCLGLAAFLGLPIAITMLAPITQLELSRDGDKVIANATEYWLYAWPGRTSRIEGVTKVTSRVETTDKDARQRAKERARRQGRSTNIHFVESAVLELHGQAADGGEAESLDVRVATDERRDLELRLGQFLASDEQAWNARLISHFWLGIVLPALLLPIGLLILFGLVMAPFQWLYRKVRGS